MRKRRTITRIPALAGTILIICLIFVGLTPTHIAFAQSGVGTSEKGVLVQEWMYDFYYYPGMYFGSSPAVANLDPYSGIPFTDLEIVTGSDECSAPPDYSGYWHAFDSSGSEVWRTSTRTDEARSSPAIADIDGDGDMEIAGGTTSGYYVQVMDHVGSFVWTFPTLQPYVLGGPFVWPSSPAVTDVSGDKDLEVIIGNRWLGSVWCFDGDNSDCHDDGVTISQADFPWSYPLGWEGIDWDVLWVFDTGITSDEVIASPAIADVDNDRQLEVVVGAGSGGVYVLNAADGSCEHVFTTGGGVYASAALANIDADKYVEIVLGSTDGIVYCFQWDGTQARTEWTFSTGGPVYSSAAIGDVDGDKALEIVVGSYDHRLYCLTAIGAEQWNCPTGDSIHSSPALLDCIRVETPSRSEPELRNAEWPMFRHDLQRTGFYGNRPSKELDVGLYICVGSTDSYLYLVSGKSGAVVDMFRTYGPIGTSPSVADVDGDGKLEVFFYDWGTGSAHGGHTFWAIEVDRVLEAEAVALAESVIGAPYQWGNKGFTSPSGPTRFMTPEEVVQEGVDCSGLVCWAYNRAYYGNRTITHEEFLDRPLYYYGADGQSRYNTVVTWCDIVTEQDLRIGDLLFFDCEKGRGPIDHVAIYVGGGYIIHSRGDIGVIKESLDTVLTRYAQKQYHKGFEGYGRVVEATIRG